MTSGEQGGDLLCDDRCEFTYNQQCEFALYVFVCCELSEFYVCEVLPFTYLSVHGTCWCVVNE